MANATVTLTLDDDEYAYLVLALKEYEKQYRDRTAQDRHLGIEDHRINQNADAIGALVQKIETAVTTAE